MVSNGDALQDAHHQDHGSYILQEIDHLYQFQDSHHQTTPVALHRHHDFHHLAIMSSHIHDAHQSLFEVEVHQQPHTTIQKVLLSICFVQNNTSHHQPHQT